MEYKSKKQLFYWQGLRLAGESEASHTENRRWYAYEENSYAPLALIDHWHEIDKDEVVYYHNQLNGSPYALSNTQGELVWETENYLWGSYHRPAQNQITLLYGQPLRFQEQYFDQETGLHYNTFSYYDPETGYFTQQDPIGLAGGLNLYQYARNPLIWGDPLGWECTRINTKQYEQKIQSMYGEKLSQASREYTAIVNGNKVKGIADYVVMLNGKRTAIEAKYVDNWATSLRNPAARIGKESFAIKEQQAMLSQAQKYSLPFENVIYHTNSPELAAHYSAIFQNAGLTNIVFKVTP